MSESARYVKIVEWSPEEGAFVGQCPGVIGPCCHGADEAEVYRELCGLVERWLVKAREEGRPLPPPTAGRNIAGYLAPEPDRAEAATLAPPDDPEATVAPSPVVVEELGEWPVVPGHEILEELG